MRLQNKRGSILITIIVAMVLMAVLGAGIYSITTSSSFSELLSNKNDNAYQLAKSGIRYATNLLAENGNKYSLYETTFQMQDGNSFTITIAADGATEYKTITSKGNVNQGNFLASSRQLSYSMPPPPPAPPTPKEAGYYVSYSGDDAQIAIPSGSTINGSIYGETVSIAPNSTITGNVISKTSITIGSGSIISGRICSSNGNVTLNASSVNVGGPINANNGNVILQSGTTAWDNVFASGNVTLKASNSSVAKDINAGGDVLIESGCSAHQNVYAGGKLTLKSSGSQVKGDVHTGGNVILNWGTPIYGTVWAGGTISSPDTTNQKGSWYINQPVPPRILPTAPTACPDVPKPQMQTFTAGGADFVVPQSQSRTITPGKYGNLIFNGGATLTIRAGVCKNVGDAGCYYFSSFQGGKWGQTLRLDLSTGSDIIIFSVGDIKHSGPVQVSTDGSTWHTINETTYQSTAKVLAKRVYWETHGNFQITTDNGTRQWFGTVLSQNNITLPSGAWIIAALATVNGSISAGANPIITYILSDFARDHW